MAVDANVTEVSWWEFDESSMKMWSSVATTFISDPQLS